MTKFFDRRLRGIGRIKRVWGTDDTSTQNAMKVMTDQLYKSGEWGLLESVRDGKLTLLQVYSRWKVQDTRSLTTTGILDFKETFDKWLAAYSDIRPDTKRRYSEFVRGLYTVRSNFSVDDVPNVLREYRKRCYKRGTHKMFNEVRNTCRSFLKNRFDQFNPVYQSVVAVKPLEVHRKQETRALSVGELWEIAQDLHEAAGQQFWTMCCTGAGMSEYRSGIEIESDWGLRIKGTKNDRRHRLVPRVVDPAPMVVQEKQLRRLINKRAQIYDCRRSYARWCLEAGIPFDRVQQYMGHSPKTMTERYARSTVSQWLEADARKLTSYIAHQKTVKINPLALQLFDFTKK